MVYGRTFAYDVVDAKVEAETSCHIRFPTMAVSEESASLK